MSLTEASAKEAEGKRLDTESNKLRVEAADLRRDAKKLREQYVHDNITTLLQPFLWHATDGNSGVHLVAPSAKQRDQWKALTEAWGIKHDTDRANLGIEPGIAMSLNHGCVFLTGMGDLLAFAQKHGLKVDAEDLDESVKHIRSRVRHTDKLAKSLAAFKAVSA
jgi:hypothetical protein